MIHMKLLLPLLALPLFAWASAPTPAEGTSSRTTSSRTTTVEGVDWRHSSMMFRVKHAGATWFYGRFNAMEGDVTLDPEADNGGQIEVHMKTESVDSNNERRDNHLKSPDFFDAIQFPTLSFKSSVIQQDEDGNLTITGELELRGVKKEITIKAEKTGEGSFRNNDVVGYHCEFTLNRSDYGINYGLGAVLGDEVRITISLETFAK